MRRRVVTLFRASLIAWLCLIGLAGPSVVWAESARPRWSDEQLALLRSLSLPALDPGARMTSKALAQPEPSNRLADDPRAAALGARLFVDPGFSANGELSCASCHRAELAYTDGQVLARGIETGVRNTPTLLGAAAQTWFYWDGRRDSLWSQALIPFEAPDEMGGSRLAVVNRLLDEPGYRQRLGRLFRAEALLTALERDLRAAGLRQAPLADAGPLGNATQRQRWFSMPAGLRDRVTRVFAMAGKAIGAYQRTLMPGPTRFDLYVASLDRESGAAPGAALLTEQEQAGAALFIDDSRTACIRCHNGPLLSNGGFHNVGSGRFEGDTLDFGRLFGLTAVLQTEFNCLGRYSDAEPAQCAAIRFLNRDEHQPLAGAFKTPTLRHLARTAPYFHDGRFATLAQVLRHYRDPPANDGAHAHELARLPLDDGELDALAAFLLTLSDPATSAGVPGCWPSGRQTIYSFGCH